MSFWRTFRFNSNLAVIAAITLLLSQTACSLGRSMAMVDGPAQIHSGCHDSAPAPSSGEKCCEGQRLNDVLIAPASPAIVSITTIGYAIVPFRSLSNPLQMEKQVIAPSPGPPSILRI